ncbi:MAG: hypothetical protein RQ745_11365, partial [Longimicrobiales bacterium]|nr:hypothetical protein [Longimicrobiales bacterium]
MSPLASRLRLLFLSVVLAACAEPAPSSGDASSEPGVDAGTVETPTVTITAPLDGDTVTGPAVEVTLALNGLTLAPAGDTTTGTG